MLRRRIEDAGKNLARALIHMPLKVRVGIAGTTAQGQQTLMLSALVGELIDALVDDFMAGKGRTT